MLILRFLLLLLLLTLPAIRCSDFAYYIKEEKSPGTLVGDIAVDAQLKGYPTPGTDPNVQFNLKTQSPTNGSDFFTLSPINMKLYTLKTVDAESLCKPRVECYLIVEMEIVQDGSLLHSLTIKVIVEDINDNGPKFPDNEVKVQFSENDAIGTSRPLPYATDDDVSIPNSQIIYELKKNSGVPFALSTSYLDDGKPEVNIYLEEKLDRETKSSYRVQLIAKDQGNPSKQSVLDVDISVTDWNDNLPEFSQNVYNVTVGFEESRNVPITVVTATDLDKGKSGKITYRISSQTSKTAKSLFRINRETGEIFLQKDINPNQSAFYRLFVKATDGGRMRHSTLSIVNINVVGSKNNAPKMEVNFVSGSSDKMAVISEGAEIGSFIAYVKVMDNDPGENGEVICDLRHSHFQLQNMGVKKYKVTVRSLIDRELRSLYEITITCRDKGSPPLQSQQKLSIRISDINDVRPVFSKKTYTFQLYENQKPQIPIGFVNATDPDLGPGGEVTYSLLKNPKTFLPFRIANGAIVIATRSLDRESKDSYRFKVLAQDNGTPSLNNTATVLVRILDENDNAPYFTFPDVNPFTLDVLYPAHRKNITTLRAVDMDAKENSHLSFRILKGNYRGIFTLDPYSGRLFFSRPPSTNDSRIYNLLLLVKDGGKPSLSSTTNLTLALAIESGNAGTLTAVKITKDFSLDKNAQMVTALIATVGSLSLAILILILALKMHHLKALCFDRGDTLSNDGGRKNSGQPTKKAGSWADISLDMKMNPSISDETLSRKNEDETETDDKKESFTSDENLYTTSEYDDPITLIESKLADHPSDERHWAKSSPENSGLFLSIPPPFDDSDEDVKSSGKYKKMRQVLNPSYYTSQHLMSRIEQPQNADADSFYQTGDNTDIPREHKAMVHDDLHHPEDITHRPQKQNSHSQVLKSPTKKKQIPPPKQQSKIPHLSQIRYQSPETHQNQSSQTPKRETNRNTTKSVSERSNSSTSQSSFSDEPGLARSRKKTREKPTQRFAKHQQELTPFKAPAELDRKPKESQPERLSPRRSPSQIPTLRQVQENPSHLASAKMLQPDAQRLADSQDSAMPTKSSTKLYQSKIPTPFSRTQESSKQTLANSENQTPDQLEKYSSPSSATQNQKQCTDERRRPKCDNLSKRLQFPPDLISQDNKVPAYSQIEEPRNYSEWHRGRHPVGGKANDSLSPRREYSENLGMLTGFANAEDVEYSHDSDKLLNPLKPTGV